MTKREWKCRRTLLFLNVRLPERQIHQLRAHTLSNDRGLQVNAYKGIMFPAFIHPYSTMVARKAISPPL